MLNKGIDKMDYRIQKYKISYVKETDSATLDKRTITNKKDCESLAKQYLSDQPYESVLALALNSANKIIGMSVTEGTVGQCSVYSKNAFSFLLSCGAASFIMCHNHPGGSTSPSAADWKITERLYSAGQLLELPLLDHLIIAGDDCISMREDSTNWPKI